MGSILTLDELDARITKHEALLKRETLHANLNQHREAIAEYKGYRNLKTDAITSKLPAEVFAEIVFHYGTMCRDPNESFHNGRFYLWLQLAHVCRYWRNTIYSSPQLFSYILVPRRVNGRHLEMTSKFIRLSGITPLYLYDHASIPTSQSRTAILSLLSQDMHRIKMVKSYHLPWGMAYHSMMNLKEMVCLNSSDNVHLHDMDSVPEYLPSTLTSLSLVCQFPFASSQVFVSFLAGLPQLEALLIKKPILPPTWDTTSRPVVATRSLKIMWIEGTVDCLIRVLRVITMTEDGSVRILGTSPTKENVQCLLRLIRVKLFKPPPPPKDVHTMRLGTPTITSSAFEFNIGSSRSLYERSVAARYNLQEDDEPLSSIFPKLHLFLIGSDLLVRLSAFTTTSVALNLARSISLTSRVIVHLNNVSRAILKGLLHKCSNLAVLELHAKGFSLHYIFKALRQCFTSTSNSPVLSHLHFLVIRLSHCPPSDKTSIQSIQSFIDLLKTRRKNGLVLHTLSIDILVRRGEIVVAKNSQDILQELRDVVRNFSFSERRSI